MLLTGWIITGLLLVFVIGASAVPKLLSAKPAVDSFVELGWSTQYLMPIGIMELCFIVLYAIPRTSLLGALLMTGLLGGAMASHIRADSALFSHTLFGLYLGAFMWAALLLRDPSLRAYFRG